MKIDPWKGGQRTVTLAKREVSTVIRLLGVLQTNLESAIDSNTLANGKPMPGDVNAAHNLRLDRRDWRMAEAMVKKLDAARRANRK